MQNACLSTAAILHYLFSISTERHPYKNFSIAKKPKTTPPGFWLDTHTLRMRDGWGSVHLKCKIVLYAAKMAASRRLPVGGGWLICMHDVRALTRPAGQNHPNEVWVWGVWHKHEDQLPPVI